MDQHLNSLTQKPFICKIIARDAIKASEEPLSASKLSFGNFVINLYWFKKFITRLYKKSPASRLLQAVISLLEYKYILFYSIVQLAQNYFTLDLTVFNRWRPRMFVHWLKSLNNSHYNRLKTFGNTIQLHCVLYRLAYLFLL